MSYDVRTLHVTHIRMCLMCNVHASNYELTMSYFVYYVGVCYIKYTLHIRMCVMCNVHAFDDGVMWCMTSVYIRVCMFCILYT